MKKLSFAFIIAMAIGSAALAQATPEASQAVLNAKVNELQALQKLEKMDNMNVLSLSAQYGYHFGEWKAVQLKIQLDAAKADLASTQAQIAELQQEIAAMQPH